MVKAGRNKHTGDVAERFVLVITPTNALAYAHASPFSDAIDAHRQLARWERGSLTATAVRRGTFTEVTLRPAGCDKVVLLWPVTLTPTRLAAAPRAAFWPRPAEPGTNAKPAG
jgi:hypothetical protein